MLERGGGGKAGTLLELEHELPRVGGVEEVDVPRVAVEHGERELLSVHLAQRGGLLVRVAPVLELARRGVVLRVLLGKRSTLCGLGSGAGALEVGLEVARDGGIVLGGVEEPGSGEAPAELGRRLPVVLAQLLEEPACGGGGAEGGGDARPDATICTFV